MALRFKFTDKLKIITMPSWKNKQLKKRKDLVKARGFFALVPNFSKDIADIRKGKSSMHKSPKDERVQAYVQARGM